MQKWEEKETKSRLAIETNAAKIKMWEELRGSSLPQLQKDEGQKPVVPLRFQPVKSPGIYEAEFTMRGPDIVFHFWPYGYHAEERAGVTGRMPRFKAGFLGAVKNEFGIVFGTHRLTVTEDPDVGAITLIATGWGENAYARELSIKACEGIHHAMGGDDLRAKKKDPSGSSSFSPQEDAAPRRPS